MTSVIWEVTLDHPDGYPRPMTDVEEAQLAIDRQAAADVAARPPQPNLQEQFTAVLDAVANSPDFDTAKKQIAVIATQEDTNA